MEGEWGGTQPSGAPGGLLSTVPGPEALTPRTKGLQRKLWLPGPRGAVGMGWGFGLLYESCMPVSPKRWLARGAKGSGNHSPPCPPSGAQPGLRARSSEHGKGCGLIPRALMDGPSSHSRPPPPTPHHPTPARGESVSSSGWLSTKIVFSDSTR